eukprot:3717508-Rhodomonas_salina.1
MHTCARAHVHARARSWLALQAEDLQAEDQRWVCAFGCTEREEGEREREKRVRCVGGEQAELARQRQPAGGGAGQEEQATGDQARGDVTREEYREEARGDVTREEYR